MVKLFLKNSNLCDHNSPTLQTDGRTDGQTDRQTTCDRNTALCTKVHRAVKEDNRKRRVFMASTGRLCSWKKQIPARFFTVISPAQVPNSAKAALRKPEDYGGKYLWNRWVLSLKQNTEYDRWYNTIVVQYNSKINVCPTQIVNYHKGV